MARRPRALSALLLTAGAAGGPLLTALWAPAAAVPPRSPALPDAPAVSAAVVAFDPTSVPADTAPVRSSGLLPPPDPDPLTGRRSPLRRDWVGLRPLPADTEILVLAGHADSQNMAGSGTPGEAVALGGAAPMEAGISDELFWNLQVAQAVVRLGQQRGLPIRFHVPPLRTMPNGNAPGTNWSVGREHVAAGGYAFEIHFDAYGPDGIGSGLIPPMHRPQSRLDESLAQEFGGYPMRYRNILGGPRRGIALLEIGKLEGTLEASLRDPTTRQQTLDTIADRVVRALDLGLGRSPQQSTPTASGDEATPQTTPATSIQPPAHADQPATSVRPAIRRMPSPLQLRLGR
ncbi:MAG: dehydrogenase [Cyanobium sp.]